MGDIGPTFIAVVAGVIGLAIVAVIVSKNAATPAVLQGAGSALAGVIGAAVAPVVSSGNNQLGSTTNIQGAAH